MPTIQSDEVALLPAALVRSRFGARAASWRDRFRPSSNLCANAEAVPGANQNDEVGSSGAARRFEIHRVSQVVWQIALVPGCLSSDVQLPGTLGFLMVSLSSCYSFFVLVGRAIVADSSQGTARPSLPV